MLGLTPRVYEQPLVYPKTQRIRVKSGLSELGYFGVRTVTLTLTLLLARCTISLLRDFRTLVWSGNVSLALRAREHSASGD